MLEQEAYSFNEPILSLNARIEGSIGRRQSQFSPYAVIVPETLRSHSARRNGRWITTFYHPWGDSAKRSPQCCSVSPKVSAPQLGY